MILEDETFEAFGYYPKDFKKYSAKYIVCACEICGNFRITQKSSYSTICVECNKRFKKFEKPKPKRKRKEKKKYKKLTQNAKEQRKRGKGKKKIERELMYKKIDRAIIHTYFDETSTKYCHLFNKEYKRKIREQYDNSCFLCGKWEKDNGRNLDVHHVFYNKSCGCNGVKCVCVPLCRSCHMKTNGNREDWTQHILELLCIEEE